MPVELPAEEYEDPNFLQVIRAASDAGLCEMFTHAII
jgi:hypothetical protein